MIRRKSLGWWVTRLFGAVLIPVSCMGVSAVLAWITQHRTPFLVYLPVLLLAIPFVANLGLNLSFLWADTLDRNFGCLLSTLHFVAVSVACGLTFFSYELWVLEWWGVETTCTLLDVQQRREVRNVNGDVNTVTYYDSAMRCPDADAPRVMTTEIPVSGEHVTVFYDPAGNIATRPASEVQASQVRAGIAAVAGAVWAVLLLGLMLLAKPAAGDPEIEPSTGDD